MPFQMSPVRAHLCSLHHSTGTSGTGRHAGGEASEAAQGRAAAAEDYAGCPRSELGLAVRVLRADSAMCGGSGRGIRTESGVSGRKKAPTLGVSWIASNLPAYGARVDLHCANAGVVGDADGRVRLSFGGCSALTDTRAAERAVAAARLTNVDTPVLVEDQGRQRLGLRLGLRLRLRLLLALFLAFLLLGLLLRLGTPRQR
jgi:predicted nuclease with RNAse H fold